MRRPEIDELFKKYSYQVEDIGSFASLIHKNGETKSNPKPYPFFQNNQLFQFNCLRYSLAKNINLYCKQTE